jgi:membrane associated rhomboid family serine protease
VKPFTVLAIIVFAIVAAVQLLRVALGWEVTINGFVVAPWASLVACAVAALLAVMVWRENRARR